MRVLLAGTIVLALLAGCVDVLPGGGPGPGPQAPQGPQVFSGRLPGEDAAPLPTRMPERFGQASFTFLERYAPEPNIGATSSGALFMSSFSDVVRSADGGRSWSVVHSHGALNNDPMLWVDAITDRVYNAPMFPTLLCSSVYWSDDDGDSWTPTPTQACGTGPFDHQKFATGPPGPGVNPLAGVLHPTVAYLCYNGVAVTNCMTSYDGGRTWPVDRPTAANGYINPGLAVTSGCLSGQNGHPTAGPDGTIAFMRTWSCVQPVLTFSQDSGLTWTNVAGPEFPGGPSDFLNTANAHSIDPEVAWTPDGTLYTLFQSHDHRAYLARTSDLGQTWQGPWDVTPPGVDSTVFAALAAGSDGRVAMGFLGAAGVEGSSTNSPEDSRWYMHLVTSEDAGSERPSFVAYQATPHDKPVQVGPILQGGGTDDTRNLLDFIDGAVTPDGTFYVAFTAGCSPSNGCSDLSPSDQTSEYRASDGAVARLEGWSLYMGT